MAVVGKKEVKNVGGVEVKEGEVLPTKILGDWCRKQKRRPGKFKNVADKGSFRYRLILQDAKNQARDMVFVSSRNAKNDEVGMEEVAILGLLHVEGERNLGLKMP
eukprot:CAMPEP_0118664664 /NCGR_PEP_ID=MMETSP0785-20121206/18151_1 /TAXON_ID=91992 /ORGANISM="Bolidomonas pacifica, Strain CCMP 1866" /LENGTH=104 /DNA_ID=CAMNT_0006558621 /DNA_START=247 /DNA_END=557 /DNA_ORIENTATION=-